MIQAARLRARRMSRTAYGPVPRTATGRPLVFAHRGSSAAEPEHTLAAYLRAIEEVVRQGKEVLVLS